jgi:signal transduction histidine kinase
VAHDLRTPLVAMADDLRSSSNQNQPVEQCRETLNRTADTADRLIELFGIILEIGEINSVRVRESGKLVDLSDLVENLAETHADVAEDGGRTLSRSIQPGIEMFGVGDLLAQALINLIQNALTHTPPGTHIHVALDASDGVARLTVADDGRGLPELDRRQILADDRLSQSSAGTKRAAIGLKLINAIATAHHGVLKIEDARPGLRAIIELPFAPSSLRDSIKASRPRV